MTGAILALALAATPATCPALVRWDAVVLEQVTASGEAPPLPVLVGSWIKLDSAAHFEDGDSSRCEDRRGAIWRVIEGASFCDTEGAGWQMLCGPMRPGRHVIEVCPRPDVQDYDERPVRVVGDACSRLEVTVR